MPCKDLEEFLIQNGFIDEYSELIIGNGTKLKTKSGDARYEEKVLMIIRDDKVSYAYGLIAKLPGKNIPKNRVPEIYVYFD